MREVLLGVLIVVGGSLSVLFWIEHGFGLFQSVKADRKERREWAVCLRHQMTSVEALTIVLEMAEKQLEQADYGSTEYLREAEAVGHVEQLIGIKYAGYFDPWIPGSKCARCRERDEQ